MPLTRNKLKKKKNVCHFVNFATNDLVIAHEFNKE